MDAYAVRRRGDERTLQRLTAEADSVVVGECKSKKVNVVGLHFETDYEVEIQESLKGGKHPGGSKVLLTVPGGTLTTPALTQLTMGQPHMFQGEQVVLFLDEKPRQLPAEMAKRADPKSKLLTTPRVVGMYEGKFSVLKDSQGARKVTRLNMESMGYAHDDQVAQRVLSAMGNGELKVTNGPAVVPSSPSGSAPAASAAPKANMPRTAGFSQALNTPGSLPPVQDFEEFKALVRGFAN